MPITIGVDARELKEHRAGKAGYVNFVLKNLLELDSDNKYVLFSDHTIDFPDFPNVKKLVIKKHEIFWHKEIAKKIERDRFDLYWAPTSPIVPALTKIPTVITIHDLTNLLFPAMHTLKGRLVENFYLKRALQRCKRIIAVSNATENDLQKLFPCSKGKTSVTLLGFDPLFHKLPEKEINKHLIKYDIDRGYILFVGTLEPRKNIESLIRAYAMLPEEIQTKHPLVIVGKKGWKYEAIFEADKKTKKACEIIFLDYVNFSDLPSLYNGASIFVFPSLYEGFGLPPLEAMACGKAVITSNISSLPEVVGDAAILINPSSEVLLSKAMLKLLKDDNIRESFEKMSLAQSKKFSWRKTAEKTLKILTEAADAQ